MINFCICGCGEEIPMFDIKGNKRTFRRGHNLRGKNYGVKLELSKQQTTCGCGCGTIIPATDKDRRPHKYVVGHTRKNRKAKAGEYDNRTGEKHPLWNGGKTVNDQGYVLRLVKDHPRANCQGYVREHILVMEKHLGRYLEKDEVVHHINHIRNDNRLENLQLMTRQEHYDLHKKVRKYKHREMEVTA